MSQLKPNISHTECRALRYFRENLAREKMRVSNEMMNAHDVASVIKKHKPTRVASVLSSTFSA